MTKVNTNAPQNYLEEGEKDSEEDDTSQEVWKSKEKKFYNYFEFISEIKVKTMLVLYFDYECDLTNDARLYFTKIVDKLASNEVVIGYNIVIGKPDLWFFLGISIQDKSIPQISFYSNKKPVIPSRVYRYLKKVGQESRLKCYKLHWMTKIISKNQKELEIQQDQEDNIIDDRYLNILGTKLIVVLFQILLNFYSIV